jgi:hypothetical protein
MAIINNSLGKLSGKVGDFIYCQRNGKTNVRRKPLGRSKNSFSESELSRQKKFGINCKLSKSINQIDEFKEFWKKKTNGKTSTFNAVSKANYDNVRSDGVISSPKLTPDSLTLDFKFGFNYNEYEIAVGLITDNFGLILDNKVDNFVMVAGVICLSNPLDDCKDSVRFIDVKSDVKKVSDGGETVFFINLNSNEKQIIENYTKRTFYYGFISKDKNGNVINSVSTFCEQLT